MLAIWEERPQEVANLLNPAFTGLVLSCAIADFSRHSNSGMPLELLALVLPLVLPERVRSQLPSTLRSTFVTWVQDHRELLVDFPERIAGLVPFSREALSSLLRQGVVAVDQFGRFVLTAKFTAASIKSLELTEDAAACVKKAAFVGRWFATAGEPSTVFALLGIRP